MNIFKSRYSELGVEIRPVELLQGIRINTLRASESDAVSALEKRGFKLKKIPFARHGYWIENSPFSIGASLEYLMGYLTPQEAASQVAVQVLSPEKEEIVIDMAASPGVKTTQIAQFMKNSGILVAVEKNNRRIHSLKNNLERLGVSNCIAYNTDSLKIAASGIKFDRVLLDAPCMGNYAQEKGWLSKHSLKEFARNTSTQKALISAAAEMLKKDGALVYSTCSLEPEENELIVDWALRNLPLRCVSTGLEIGDSGFTEVFGKRLSKDVSHTRRFWPQKTGTQGFFIAKLVRK